MASSADERREKIYRKRNGLRAFLWLARWIGLILETRSRRGATQDND